MRQFARYVGVQALAYGLDMGTFLVVLRVFGDHPLSANVAGKILAGSFAFVVHRYFTFRSVREHHRGQAAKYLFLLALNLPLSTAVLSIVIRTGLSEPVCKIISDTVLLGITYWLSQRFVFRKLKPVERTP